MRLIGGKSASMTPTGLVIVNDDSSYAESSKRVNRYDSPSEEATDDIVEHDNKSSNKIFTTTESDIQLTSQS